MTRVELYLGLALALVISAPARAQDAQACQLDRFSTLPITTLPDGRFTVPVTLNGEVLNFLVDTGGVSATIAHEQSLNLRLVDMPVNKPLRGVGGIELNRFAVIDKFSLGRLEGTGIPVWLDPILPRGADGTLSPDMMKRYDVEIDFPRGTLSLFSQKHCPGQVVHWTRSGFVVLPMEVASNGHIEVPVTVDGKKFTAILDTGAQSSIISLGAARALGITEKSPDLKPLKMSDPKYRGYDYPFKSLDFDGISVANPRLQIVSDNFLPGMRTDMIVGISILRRLHLYIAYGEEKLYITPAGAN
jgi:predicted aspartyl protease